MKLLVIGANGATGSATVARALAEGHDVVQLVRRADAVTDTNARRGVGDPLDAATVVEAASGCDAIASALGVRSLGKTTLVSRGVAAMIEAAARGATDRMLVVSAFGASDSLQLASPGARLLYRTVMGNILADKARADTLLRSSSLDWTILYPGVLRNTPLRPYESVPLTALTRVGGLPTSTRASVAEVLVTAAAQHTLGREAVLVRDV